MEVIFLQFGILAHLVWDFFKIVDLLPLHIMTQDDLNTLKSALSAVHSLKCSIIHGPTHLQQLMHLPSVMHYKFVVFMFYIHLYENDASREKRPLNMVHIQAQLETIRTAIIDLWELWPRTQVPKRSSQKGLYYTLLKASLGMQCMANHHTTNQPAENERQFEAYTGLLKKITHFRLRHREFCN